MRYLNSNHPAKASIYENLNDRSERKTQYTEIEATEDGIATYKLFLHSSSIYLCDACHGKWQVKNIVMTVL